MSNEFTLKELYALRLYEVRTIDFGVFTMTIKRNSDDWEAKINGDKGNWTVHKQLDYAVGYVLLSYYSDNLATKAVNNG